MRQSGWFVVSPEYVSVSVISLLIIAEAEVVLVAAEKMM